MRAYKCDACGSFFQKKCEPDVKVSHHVHPYGEEKWDFCYDCMKKIIKFCSPDHSEKLIKDLEGCYYDEKEVARNGKDRFMR